MAARRVDLVPLAGVPKDGITVRQAADAIFGVKGVTSAH